jgi:peptidoglycan/xylan/chitin deacetylase (PgdA/CDA1 family)
MTKLKVHIRSKAILLTLILTLSAATAPAQGIMSLSFDDPTTAKTPMMSWQERNQKILQTLQAHQLSTVLFVCRMRVDHPEGQALLRAWDNAGHAIANHSVNHPYLGGKKATTAQFKRELLGCDSMIAQYKHYTKLFRFPFLKEGGSAPQRDSMRAVLAANGYQNGYVSIDASDWYIDQKLTDSLRKNPMLDMRPYRDYYIAHILDRAQYYDPLSTALTGRKVQHVLLLHHNLLNALFLDNVIRALAANGWAFHNTTDAYHDQIYQSQPNTIPAGESIVWSLAKASGKYDKVLRYPAEDGEYEAEGLKKALSK